MILLWVVLCLMALVLIGALGWLNEDDTGFWAGVVVAVGLIAWIVQWVMG